jgi:hypothetical protein
MYYVLVKCSFSVTSQQCSYMQLLLYLANECVADDTFNSTIDVSNIASCYFSRPSTEWLLYSV